MKAPKITASGNIRLTITPREATVLLGLAGPTTGNDGYRVYNVLHALIEQGHVVARL